MNNTNQSWFVYIIKCDNDSLYTGITTNMQRRFAEHLAVAKAEKGAKGAKYFRSRVPEFIAYSETCRSRSEASKREWSIKQLSAAAKRKMIAQNKNTPPS